MKRVKIQKAIGMVLGHDLTRIVPGSFKGAAFKKGHIIQEEDIPILLDMGKETLFVLDIPPGRLHENDAAGRLAQALKGDHLSFQGPVEGKISLTAQISGLLKVRVADLTRLNLIPNIMVSTLHNNSVCTAGDTVAATRIIPLTIDEKSILKAETICSRSKSVVSIKPFYKKRVGVVVTGSEFYTGRVQDGFEEWVGKKLEAYGCEIIRKETVPDKVSRIAETIKSLIDSECDLIVTTGGMSVDPDDVTRKGSAGPGPRLYFSAPRYCPGPCSSMPVWGRSRSWDCRPVSFIIRSLFLICSCL